MTENETKKEAPQYDRITVTLGTYQPTRDGRTELDTQHEVIFSGREINNAEHGDTRGQTITLYEVPVAERRAALIDGQMRPTSAGKSRIGYRVHVDNWSRWQGESRHQYLACIHGEGCPADEDGRMCRETVLSAAQVAERWPSWAKTVGVVIDLDA